MKPSFAIVDWDMFVRPIVAYVGPDEIPDCLNEKIVAACGKTRYDDVVTPSFVRDKVAAMANDLPYLKAKVSQCEDCSFIRIWTYDDATLAHEILHVIHDVCEMTGIRDDEFESYALQWLMKDFVFKLTGRFQKPIHFRRTP